MSKNTIEGSSGRNNDILFVCAYQTEDGESLVFLVSKYAQLAFSRSHGSIEWLMINNKEKEINLDDIIKTGNTLTIPIK